MNGPLNRRPMETRYSGYHVRVPRSTGWAHPVGFRGYGRARHVHSASEFRYHPGHVAPDFRVFRESSRAPLSASSFVPSEVRDVVESRIMYRLGKLTALPRDLSDEELLEALRQEAETSDAHDE